ALRLSALIPRPPPRSVLFPYTTLFRSGRRVGPRLVRVEQPIGVRVPGVGAQSADAVVNHADAFQRLVARIGGDVGPRDGTPRRNERKSRRLNTRHVEQSYAVFCRVQPE